MRTVVAHEITRSGPAAELREIALQRDEVVEKPNFARRWDQARRPDQLNDVVLLSGRQRHLQRPGEPPA
ncbi:MAG: hypothetical protein ACLFVY_07910 [Phycisphaerae bacterium]